MYYLINKYCYFIFFKSRKIHWKSQLIHTWTETSRCLHCCFKQHFGTFSMCFFYVLSKCSLHTTQYACTKRVRKSKSNGILDIPNTGYVNLQNEIHLWSLYYLHHSSVSVHFHLLSLSCSQVSSFYKVVKPVSLLL